MYVYNLYKLKLPVTGFPLESVTLTTDWVTGFPLASAKNRFILSKDLQVI